MTRIFLPLIIVCLIMSNAFAGSPTTDGLDAEVYSISVNPEQAVLGTHPEVIGNIQNKLGQNAVLDVKVVVTLPNKSKKAWWWNDSNFLPNQKKAYPLGSDYDISQTGTYLIEFSVYNSSRTRLISSLSKTFTVKEAVVKAPPPISTVKETAEPLKTVTPASTVAAPKPVVASKPEAQALQPQKTVDQAARCYFGIGGYANTINFSGGPTVILWPLKNLAIQGSYGWGTFESYEIRGFYRIDLSSRLKPYLGAGYFHTERDFEVTSSGNTVEGTMKGSSYTVFGGVEVSLIKDRLALYVDVSGTPLKLEDDVTIGTDKVKISVDYSPVTIGTGLVFYIW